MSNPMKNWKLNEIVTLVVLSVTIGVLWWGFAYTTPLLTPLKPFGLSYLLSGFWFIGGVLIPFFIRKPGAALIGETLAAGIEALVSQWGLTVLVWGAFQGLGAELIFLAFRYKRYDLFILILASMLSGLFAWGLDFFYFKYWTLAPWLWVIQIICLLSSAALFSGYFSHYLGKNLVKAGITPNLASEESL